LLFNSFEYFAFFTIVLAVSWLMAPRPRLRTWFILLASLYFYYSNNHWQILLLLFAATVDYLICLRMQDEKHPTRRKALLSVSLISNLGLLFYFKYINFFGESLQALANAAGFRLDWIDLNVALPVGISFYTFEALSYTIDVYRGEIRAERQWSKVAFLVSFFPHLIAGPIVRAKSFFPQIGQPPRLSARDLELAVFLLAIGLLKKIIIADTLAGYADNAFDHAGSVGSLAAWLGVYAFSFQIYFDFSGYTDIALGSALLLGYQLPPNFNRPYASISITDFWRRWHMTLSSWLRDYLYIPLGGNRMRTRLGVYRNLILTMFLGGLWHGAAWHFAVWGVLHGALLAVERALGIGTDDQAGPARRLWRAAIIFQIVTFLWIPFRAGSLGAVGRMLAEMFAFDGRTAVTNGILIAIAVIVMAWLWQLLALRSRLESLLFSTWLPVKAAAYAAVVVGVLIMSSGPPRAFIYFQF
jgi:alginate O-acetyltransferase complex protein AlgI